MYGTEYRPGVQYPNVNDQLFVPGQEGVRCHVECLEGCSGPGAHECTSCKNYQVVGENKVSNVGPCSSVQPVEDKFTTLRPTMSQSAVK